MRAKKPLAYMRCPRCKGSNLHHEASDATSKRNLYVCNDCSMQLRMQAEKPWKGPGDKPQKRRKNAHKKHVPLTGYAAPLPPRSERVVVIPA